MLLGVNILIMHLKLMLQLVLLAKFLLFFGKVASSTSSFSSTTIHPLPSMKYYENFNSLDTGTKTKGYR